MAEPAVASSPPLPPATSNGDIGGASAYSNGAGELVSGERGSGGSNRSHIRMSKVDTKLRAVLQKYDTDGDNKITRPELENVINSLVRQQFRNKIFLFFLLGLTCYMLLLAGSIFGLTWAVMAANKETEVHEGKWTNPDGATLQIAGADIAVGSDGFLGGASGASASIPAASAAALIKAQLVNATPATDLRRLESIVIQTLIPPPATLAARTQLSLQVRAVSKLGPAANTLRVDTHDGVLVLTGSVWWVEDPPGPFLNGTGLLGEADPTGTMRRLVAPESESLAVYGLANGPVSSATTLCTTAGAKRVTASSCSQAFTACGLAPAAWGTFASNNFAACEGVTFAAVPSTTAYCC